MFKLLRLFRRDDHIDDAASAYIEGRATERDQAELRDRAVREPQLFQELDSIRDTVALLRSIEPAKAPRSFALASAPVQIRVKRSRIAMAPAVFAIAAAAAVGLLAVGNLAEVVRQSDSPSSTGASGSSAADSVSLSESDQEADIAAITGPSSGTGLAGADLENSNLFGELERAPSAVGTSTPSASSFLPMPTTVPGDSSTEPVAPPGQPAGGSDTEAVISPDFGTAIDGGAGIDVGPEQSSMLGSDEPMPLPESTVTGQFSITEPLGVASTDPSGGIAAQPEQDKSGYPLPLWQLQVLFASIAVLMAGAWMVLQRRLTA